MKFIIKPSLEHMALVKIVISLWKQNDVRQLIVENLTSRVLSSPLSSISLTELMKIEKIVTEKVPQLPLSHILIGKLLGLFKPIGLEILKWMVFHCKKNIPAYLPAEFCWTPQGTVDRKRTAEVLIKDENLDISTRYKLACIYCLDNEMNKLWNYMPDNLKDFFSNQEAVSVNIHNYKDLFLQSVKQSNKAAAEYYLQKLTPEEREESLVEAAEHTNHDTVCFLLSQMNDQKQIEVLKSNPSDIMKCFLQWPLQSFFAEIAKCMWDFLSTEDYAILLSAISGKLGHIDWDYENLFREFWQESPSALKNSIRNEIHKWGFLQVLFLVKDKEKVRLILKDTPDTAKIELIYSIDMEGFVVLHVLQKQWDVLEFCVQELFLLINSMYGTLLFKSHFEMRMKRLKERFDAVKSEWDKLFSNLVKKRKNVEEGERSTSKRIRHLQ